MSVSLTRGGGVNVPGIPGACSTLNVTYLVRGPLWGHLTNATKLRNYSQRFINKFLNRLKGMEWSSIAEIDDAQLAYSTFYKLPAEKCASCFPEKWYHHNLSWLTTDLKESI